MNCFRISPGTVRKPGAMLRKCAAQAFWSIEGGNLYCTIAVIIMALLSGSLRRLLQCRRRLAERGIDIGERGGDRLGPVRPGADGVQVTVGFGLGVAAHRDRQCRQPSLDALRRL